MTTLQVLTPKMKRFEREEDQRGLGLRNRRNRRNSDCFESQSSFSSTSCHRNCPSRCDSHNWRLCRRLCSSESSAVCRRHGSPCQDLPTPHQNSNANYSNHHRHYRIHHNHLQSTLHSHSTFSFSVVILFIVVYTHLFSFSSLFSSSLFPSVIFPVNANSLQSRATNLPPRFKSDGSDFDSQSEIVVRVKEGASSLNKEIYHLSGEDPDNDSLSFGVLGTLGKDLLRIDSVSSTEAKIYLKKELDREIQDSYTLVLTLTDGKLGKGNYVTKSLLLIVEDINDNAPIFRPFRTAVSVREDAKPGTLIETVEAFDSDEGRFGQVLYQLEEENQEPNSLGSNQIFTIQTADGKGIIRLSGSLDYEKKSLYQIRVLAIDRAMEGARKTSTAAIVIQVEDVDDQPPVFTSVPSVTRIAEDMPVGASVLQITAIDGDRGINNKISYRITKGGDGLFAINPNTGLVTIAGKLDRESSATAVSTQLPGQLSSSAIFGSSSYILEIEATEQGTAISPPPAVTTEVTIILTDVNDEIPRFRSSSYTAEIAENSPPDMPVTFTGRMSKSNEAGGFGGNFLSPQVYDLDQGNNGSFTLHLELEDDHLLNAELRSQLNDAFYVTPLQSTNEATLSVRVRNPLALDYEKLKSVKLRLIAKERSPSIGNSLRFSTAELYINIKDANDNTPHFSQDTYYGSVSENASPGTVVARVNATDIDEGLYGTEGIRYTALRGEMAAALTLNPTTGVISVRQVVTNSSHYFDRERHTQHFLIVEARDAAGFGNRNTVQLVINITDVNDHAPRFAQPSYEIRIGENLAQFEPEVFVTAIDDDAPNTSNSRLSYSIVNNTSSAPFSRHFAIDPNSGKVLIRSPLDFESIPGPVADIRNISFLVRATDHGSPPLHADVPVTVQVIDQNDNAPVFSKTLYMKSIPEDVRDGSMVIQVSATDADQSLSNSRIYYRLLSGGADKFVIDANTGIISVAKGASLDPDKSLSIGSSKMSTKLWYLLKVMAIDSSFGTNEQQSSIATVNVSIVDVNNKPPEFPNDLPEVYVSEDSPINQYVTRIMAFDPDDKPILRYSFDYSRSEARNEFGVAVDLVHFTECFSIGPVDGVVRVAKVLDRELWSELKLQVVVEDIAAVTKGQKARATFTIHVTDVNDNRPRFTQRHYRAVVPENSIPGTSVITVTAEDRDTNKSLVYSLESGEQIELLKLLRINHTTGEVSVIGRIDREVYNWINVTVRAADTGEPSLHGTASLSIQVLDENDNNPVFDDENLHKVTIPEDAPVGSLVVRVTASDADIGAFGKLTYQLDSSSSFGKFKIDRETGSIIVADKLDREQMSTYKLLVQAWDNYEYGFSTGESRKAFKTLTIVITDVNDETPRIISPMPDSECTSITEFHSINDVVVAVKAFDADDAKLLNGKVSFEIINGNEDKLFEFVDDGGENNEATLRTRNSVRGRVGNYSLLIKVTDGGLPSRSSTSPVKICITDVNDHNPIFVKPPSNMTIRIAENATIGTKVVDVLALDSDNGLNAEVRYRLRELPNGHWRYFQIDPISGVITLAKELDRETQRVHELRVQAYDLGTPTTLSTDMDITILVTNVDDFEPEFTQDIFQVVFTENLEPGTERYKLLPTIDKDDFDFNDPNSAFKSIPCYFIVGGDGLTDDGEELFRLDTFTHELTATRPLDREKKSNYTLIVQATNDCFKVPQRVDRFDAKDNSLLQVLIGVRDVNDNAPKFVKKIFSGGITTDTDYGTVFMSIKAIDPDVGSNSLINYYIVSDVRRSLSEGLETMPARPFVINRRTGEISVNFDPQKGMKGYFEFDVKANDTEGLSDSAKVFIYLLRDDQRVRFVLRLTPQELRGKLDHFQDVLTNITGALVNVDSYRFHETDDGGVDQKKTDLYLHFVNRADNSIMEVNSVLLLIDKNIDYLDDLYKEFNVLVSEPNTIAEPFMEWEDQLKAGLAGTSAFLFLLLILVISLCLNQKNRYQRQLKAATVPIFGHEPQLVRSNVPNTNQHATEGSNPMWMTGYDNQWYKDEERISDGSSSSSSSSNSLDENALTNAAIDEDHFSSLDTLDHVDAVDRESSGHSSSSTTNDRSALCRNSALVLGRPTLPRPLSGGTGNFGTIGRRPTVQPPPLPNNPPPATAKKPMAPKPPPPPNVIVISQTSTKSEPLHHGQNSHYNQAKQQLPANSTFSTGNPAKSPCINNIYIETFSNHHKSQNNNSNGGSGTVHGKNSVPIGTSTGSHGHYQSSAINPNIIIPNGSVNDPGHAHYHHYHHHHPQAPSATSNQHYYGVPNGTLINNGGVGGPVVGHHGHYHHPESQLMNLETTEL